MNIRKIIQPLALAIMLFLPIGAVAHEDESYDDNTPTPIPQASVQETPTPTPSAVPSPSPSPTAAEAAETKSQLPAAGAVIAVLAIIGGIAYAISRNR